MIQLYLKDIVSLDTFSSQVKLIAKIKPVLNMSPDSLHSASHNGSEWGALENKICLTWDWTLEIARFKSLFLFIFSERVIEWVSDDRKEEYENNIFGKNKYITCRVSRW